MSGWRNRIRFDSSFLAKALIGFCLCLICGLLQAAPEKQKVTIAVGGKAALYYLPLTLAERLGYFKDEGLDVQILDFAGGSKALQAMMGGSADVVAGGFDHVIILRAREAFGSHVPSRGSPCWPGSRVSACNLPTSSPRGKRSGRTRDLRAGPVPEAVERARRAASASGQKTWKMCPASQAVAGGPRWAVSLCWEMTRPAPIGCADFPIASRLAGRAAGVIRSILALAKELSSSPGIAGIRPAPRLQWTWRVAAPAPNTGQAT